MIFIYQDRQKNAEFRLIIKENNFWKTYGRQTKDEWLTIAWNTGETQKIIVDEIESEFPADSILPLVANQYYSFTKSEDIIAWQFNRDFYCIVNHDKEVGCVGFLFYGTSQTMFLSLDARQQRRIALLFEVFKDEFEHADNIQGEMLRILLVRLIISITRIGKQQYRNPDHIEGGKFDLYRKFNLMVEVNYKQQHEVQFYASALHKSPKTLANVFALYGRKSPSQIIYDRIILEAKRLFYYTDKSAKEIYIELGFEDASHFSRFFKRQTNLSPSDFKKSISTGKDEEAGLSTEGD
ncbi:MAG TPA: helix-turn-helix domain-containing protein [Ohtaekwangia sp.]|uniref:helix-turn-helix domain-containing protein n=1 Tax=Ohtaekwangia sp. TaxID=2066019 RepID=UPI002F95A85C